MSSSEKLTAEVAMQRTRLGLHLPPIPPIERPKRFDDPYAKSKLLKFRLANKKGGQLRKMMWDSDLVFKWNIGLQCVVNDLWDLFRTFMVTDGCSISHAGCMFRNILLGHLGVNYGFKVLKMDMS